MQICYLLHKRVLVEYVQTVRLWPNVVHQKHQRFLLVFFQRKTLDVLFVAEVPGVAGDTRSAMRCSPQTRDFLVLLCVEIRQHRNSFSNSSLQALGERLVFDPFRDHLNIRNSTN